ncbi:MAG: ribosomal RNA small subunit methyltransferase A [Deltaproteobacteria bacterium]|nr:MAG: ribosomal RNA small subunit methyltransferase A [Deltaproteobacteria bacterium]
MLKTGKPRSPPRTISNKPLKCFFNGMFERSVFSTTEKLGTWHAKQKRKFFPLAVNLVVLQSQFYYKLKYTACRAVCQNFIAKVFQTTYRTSFMQSPKTVLRAHRIEPKKSLGQNFLCDRQAAEMIVRRCGLKDGDVVVEIGAGTGVLTIPAARRVSMLYAVETDSRLIEPLAESIKAAGLENVTILHRDILETDITEICHRAGKKLVVIGNLPYYISSRILIELVKKREAVSRAVLMFQQELAQRLTAGPGSRDYGRISVALRYCASVKTVARLRPDLFFPRPGVHSEVIEITFKERPRNMVCSERLFFDIIKAAFAKRRKTVKNALSTGLPGLDGRGWEHVLSMAGVRPGARAETLDVDDFINICNRYESTLLAKGLSLEETK